MADKGPAGWLDLADALSALRDQLAEAQARAYYSPIHLSVDDVTIEFGLELQRSGHAGGELRFGVVSLDGGGQLDRKATHTVTVHLTAHGEDGAAIEVSDVDDGE